MPPRDKPLDPADLQAVLRRQGHFWTVVYEDTTILVRDGIGLRYLEPLLRHPKRPFHVIDLAAIGAGGDDRDSRVGQHERTTIERVRKAVTNAIRRTVTQLIGLHEPLGLHLHNAIRTGTRCEYRPDRRIQWER